MNVSGRQREALIVLLISGTVTPADVARCTGMSLQAVTKWTDAGKARQARHRRAAAIISTTLAKHDRMPSGDGHSRDEDKRATLSKIRKGELTIKKAAKIMDVPISGILGWMRLARIPIPEPYASRRNRYPKEPSK